MKASVKSFLRAAGDFLPDRIHRWRRRRQLSAERQHYTAEHLRADLDRLDIADQGIVLLHSSLKAIGFVEGGPEAVVKALVESVVERRGGTLLVPTFSIHGTMRTTLAKGQEGEIVFDVNQTPSNLGAIPEAFRRHPQALRSIHPTHSFGAIGPLASDLVADHHRCGSSFGEGSPMARMLRRGGQVLGLGTNLGNVTFYHCLEELEPDFPFSVYSPDSPFRVPCREADGQLIELVVSGHDEGVSQTRIDRPQNAAIRDYVTRALEDRAGLRWYTVCDARSWLVSAQPFYEEIKRQMHRGITIYSTAEQLKEVH
jgi:aminoglycoside 3-N-acetyltransferase